MGLLYSRYTHWLHTRWPAGTVEKLPECDERGRTNLPGVRIVGDLTGIPLLKFASDSGARAAREMAAELRDESKSPDDSGIVDIAIVGAGVAGISAAIEGKRLGLKVTVFESAEAFSTVVNFPKAKPIFTYPTDMQLDGGLQLSADVKEKLLEELESQRLLAALEPEPANIERIERTGDRIILHHAGGKRSAARRVIVAIGRSGNFRKLGLRGEALPKVSNRLHDPHDFKARRVVVVGGGDSALEAAVALADAGAEVTLSYRGKEFSRAKPENVAKAQSRASQPGTAKGSLQIALDTQVQSITPDTVTLVSSDGRETRLLNEAVFTMIGREAPLEFFRRSGIPIRGEWRPGTWASFIAFGLFCIWMYHWKAGSGFLVYDFFKQHGWFPFSVPEWLATISAASKDPKTLVGTISLSADSPSFYYTIGYCLLVVIFGARRVLRRRTAYVTAQTLTFTAVQILPLFLLPMILLPWMGANGWFDSGTGRWFADQFFPVEYGARSYWRAFGFVLAWPLFIWNLFTDHPTTGWLVLSFVQTFAIIPLIVWRWGKGAYCGWICSCGALAETLGDTHRHKMPHGPRANRWNMTGQIILAVALFLLVLRIFGWIAAAVPALSWLGFMNGIYYGLLGGFAPSGPLSWFSYRYIVDLWLAGVVGVGAYFWFSGRVWCRFACPLAALMHIYARFSRYRIFADKKKCISCNVCTTVCHQGIDVMNFANKGLPMEDPECVRCSACVQQCPTGVLAFGHLDGAGVPVLDRIAASPVRTRE